MKLTAEQVRDAIERHVEFYEGGDYDEQAIADELNAALGALEPHSNQLEPTRWHELFGTPERAARTLMERCIGSQCPDCPLCHDDWGETCELPPKICAWVDEENGYDALLEWLRGDA